MSSQDLVEEAVDFDSKFGKPLNLRNKIMSAYPNMAIAAEFKRASPSKGDINTKLDPISQCLQYAEAGASIVSVLTEKLHFKGIGFDLDECNLHTYSSL